MIATNMCFLRLILSEFLGNEFSTVSVSTHLDWLLIQTHLSSPFADREQVIISLFNIYYTYKVTQLYESVAMIKNLKKCFKKNFKS